VSRGACGPLCILHTEIGFRTAADRAGTRASFLGRVCTHHFNHAVKDHQDAALCDPWIGRGSSPGHRDLLTSSHLTSSPIEIPVESGDDLVATVQFW